MDVVARILAGAERNAHANFKRDLDGPATIASTASFVGPLGTVIGIMDTFNLTILLSRQKKVLTNRSA
jgi:biopolymer transport protein ExbB/TolQ